MVGGETGGGWGLRGPRGLSLEECCLYLKDTHFTHSQKQMGTPHSHHGYILPRFCLLFYFFSNFSLPLFHLPLFLTLLLPSITLYVLLSTSSLLSTFQVLLHPKHSASPPNFIPSFSCPFFPTRHAHLCVSCMFCDSQTINFFSRTRPYQNSVELLWRMGVFFSERVCFSL